MYFDWWISQPAFAPPYLQRMAAYYYDESASRKQGPVLTYKQEAFPPDAAVLDIERGKLRALRLQPWQSDTSVSIKIVGLRQGRRLPDRRLAAHRPDRRGEQERQPTAQCRTRGRRHHRPGNSRRAAADGRLASRSMAKPSMAPGPGCCMAKEPTNAAPPAARKSTAPTLRPTYALRPRATAFTRSDFAWPRDGNVLIKTLYAGTPYLGRPVEKRDLARQFRCRRCAGNETATGLEIQAAGGAR